MSGDAVADGQPGDRLAGPGRREDRQPAGEPCGAEAPYVVSVGQRRHDAQASCGIHLAAAVAALEGAEDRRADITIRARAKALIALAEATADRDRFREQARLLGEEKAEWLCEACEVIHPWRDGDRFTAACPDCGWPMVPTSPSLRSRQVLARRADAAEAKLAAIAEHRNAACAALRTAETVARHVAGGDAAADRYRAAREALEGTGSEEGGRG